MLRIFLKIYIIILKRIHNAHNKIFFEKMDILEIHKNSMLLFKV